MDTAERKYYFAYGSNMIMADMRLRCPEALFVQTGKIEGYRFIVNELGYGTIVKNRDSCVYGVVWSITKKDEKALDAYEGMEEGLYEKEEFFFDTLSRGRVPALVYIAINHQPGIPRKEYIEKIVASAHELNFPGDYIRELKRWQTGNLF
jgi:gamma-glutamylcyclotransferase (GGCT)/AIG2-like uncharacterized protein YtfP